MNYSTFTMKFYGEFTLQVFLKKTSISIHKSWLNWRIYSKICTTSYWSPCASNIETASGVFGTKCSGIFDILFVRIIFSKGMHPRRPGTPWQVHLIHKMIHSIFVIWTIIHDTQNIFSNHIHKSYFQKECIHVDLAQDDRSMNSQNDS